MSTAVASVPETLAATELTAAEIAAFQMRGFHLHGKVFSDAEVAELLGACERVCNREYETGIEPDSRCWNPGDSELAVRKIDNGWKANRTVRKFATSERLGRIAAQLIGAPSIRLFHDQYLHKPARGGKVVTWHQDWAYWQMIDQPRTVTCWIALDDVYADSGPMMFLEGSHKLGLHSLPMGITGDDEQKPRLPDGLNLKEVPVIIKKGCVSFHHGLTLHGSAKNTGNTPRRALVAHVMSGESRYRPSQPHICERMMKLQANCPQPGELLAGPQFPPLWPVE